MATTKLSASSLVPLSFHFNVLMEAYSGAVINTSITDQLLPKPERGKRWGAAAAAAAAFWVSAELADSWCT